jgi:GrpB-like predicted nucleotidyltransferase (UPF0157 family)
MCSEKKRIELVDYQVQWPRAFEREAKALRGALGELLIAAHHVGSTSVPGLCSKDKLDIILVVRNAPATHEPLGSIGYTFRGEWNVPFKHGFAKRGVLAVNLHVYEEGHPEISLNLRFRNYLREHGDVRERYGALKQRLACSADSAVKEEGARFHKYTLGKHTMIQEILRQAGADELRFLACSHDQEWDYAHGARQSYFDQRGIEAEPLIKEGHAHFIFYRGVDSIGYVDLELEKEKLAILKVLYFQDADDSPEVRAQALSWVNQWLASHGYRAGSTSFDGDAHAVLGV